MLQDTITRFAWICDNIPSFLLAIPIDEMSNQPAPGKWSRKEIIGHLIDSAANNHQRFIRAQYETVPLTIVYDQNNWNLYNNYQTADTANIIQLWAFYNRQLLHIMQTIIPANLQKECYTSGSEPHTLEYLMMDYVTHLEYHLQQVLVY
jgi:hypothetical protein